MTFREAVKICFRKYATFSGRAGRPEFWWFVLFLILASAALSVVDLEDLFWLATLLPWLAVAARRLHDIGRSAWWLLVGLVPLIGWLVLLYFYVQPGEPEANRYGPPAR